MHVTLTARKQRVYRKLVFKTYKKALCNWLPVAYPELVSRGVSKTRKFKWLVKVGASIYQTPDLKKILAGGGFRATTKNLDTPLASETVQADRGVSL